MTDTLTVGYLNVHNRVAALNAILQSRPDTVGLGEGQRLMRAMAARTRYQTVVENTRQGPRDHSQETPILTRRKYPTLGRLTLQVSETVQPVRIAPERWMTVHLFQHPLGPIAHLNVHLNAGPRALRGDNPKVPLVREYAESVRSLDRALSYLDAEGFIRVLTGDVNLNDMRDDPPWSPYPVLEAHDMVVHHASPIDVVAHDDRLALDALRVLPKAKSKSDHPGAVAILRRHR